MAFEGEHAEVLREAIACEGEAHRALLAGDAQAGRAGMRAAAAGYRASWEVAPPRSFGRLVGMLKAAVIGGAGDAEAAFAREQLGDDCDSPTGCYALAIAALVQRDDATALRAAGGMREASPAFGRAADAVQAIAQDDEAGCRTALAAIAEDFEGRPDEQHLTGVRIADTALMLAELAERRGMTGVRPASALLPPQ